MTIFGKGSQLKNTRLLKMIVVWFLRPFPLYTDDNHITTCKNLFGNTYIKHFKSCKYIKIKIKTVILYMF